MKVYLVNQALLIEFLYTIYKKKAYRSVKIFDNILKITNILDKTVNGFTT